MAIPDSTKLDLLYKKVGYGVSETSTGKAPSEESIASPFSILSTQVWQQADKIPTVMAQAVNNVVEDHSAGVFLLKDPTVPAGTTWLAVRTIAGGLSDNNRLRDWIPFTVAPSYEAKIYKASPFSSTSRLLPNTVNNEWYFDYTSGVLTFLNALPAGVTELYITGFRYIGAKGVGGNSAPQPVDVTFVTDTLSQNQVQQFTLDTSALFILQSVQVDRTCKVECHSTSAYNDTNPYGFISTATHLIDDGSYTTNNATFYGPRFITLMNLESPSSGKSFWRITNTNAIPTAITLRVTVLPY